LLNPKSINLLGIDMALNEKGTTHISTHNSSKDIDNQQLFSIKGNIRDTVKTTAIYYQSYLNTQMIIDKFKDTNIFNLSDGVYFNHTTPLNIENYKNNNIILDKTIIKKDLISQLLRYSAKGLQNEDKIVFQTIIKDMNNILSNNTIPISGIMPFLNNILSSNYHKEYIELIYNYAIIITPYIDKFLNNSNFTQKSIIQHREKIYKLFLHNILKLTIDFRNIFKYQIL